LRIIREAVNDGGVAINYVKAHQLIMDQGDVKGVTLTDMLTGAQVEAFSRVVINATGVWTDELRNQVGGTSHIRPLRGSHLIFPRWRLPVAQAVSFLHPFDHRPVFIFPWESVTLVGTTDVDHEDSLDAEPRISPNEVAYLMAAVEYQFPSLCITLGDILSTYAGVRPIISSGKTDPSAESRDHSIWEEHGLYSVTGGKLTTFRLIALDVLKAVRNRLPDLPEPEQDTPVLNQINQQLPGCNDLRDACRRRLLGRYGLEALAVVNMAHAGEMEKIPGTEYLWVELRWAARSEGVCHLDDLLLRRTRLGLILPAGAESIMPEVKEICLSELQWNDNRWHQELAGYQSVIAQCYSSPSIESIPDWKALLSSVMIKRRQSTSNPRKKIFRQTGLAVGVMLVATVMIAILWINHRRSGEIEGSA
jgi:glycerol-3-phosphate dehydrogenase